MRWLAISFAEIAEREWGRPKGLTCIEHYPPGVGCCRWLPSCVEVSGMHDSWQMNWKGIVLGFAAGCVIASIGARVARSPVDARVLHIIEVNTIDEETRIPVPVTRILYPDHPDFGGPEQRILARVSLGTEAGVTRVVWVGRGRAEEYRFTLSAEGYEDVVVPPDLIESTEYVTSGIQVQPDFLPMKKAVRGDGR